MRRRMSPCISSCDTAAAPPRSVLRREWRESLGPSRRSRPWIRQATLRRWEEGRRLRGGPAADGGSGTAASRGTSRGTGIGTGRVRRGRQPGMQGLQFATELADLGDLLADDLHLVPVLVAEPLDDHRHDLLELVEHLLLLPHLLWHRAGRVREMHEGRILELPDPRGGRADPPGHLPARRRAGARPGLSRSWTVDGGHREHVPASRGHAPRVPRTIPAASVADAGRIASETDQDRTDPQFVAVVDPPRADARPVDDDPAATEQVDGPDSHRRAQEAAMEPRDPGGRQPDLAMGGPSHQGQRAVHLPGGWLGRLVREFQDHAARGIEVRGLLRERVFRPVRSLGPRRAPAFPGRIRKGLMTTPCSRSTHPDRRRWRPQKTPARLPRSTQKTSPAIACK